MEGSKASGREGGRDEDEGEREVGREELMSEQQCDAANR